jgi:hypothetical protein
MPSSWIVEPFNVIEYVGSQFIPNPVVAFAKTLSFEGRKEAFHCCVIPTISSSTHAANNSERIEQPLTLMRRAQELGEPADWLIRAAHNRCLPDGGKLWDHTTAAAPVGQIEFTMASRHGVKARPVRQQLWAQRVDLRNGAGAPLSVTSIVAREIDAPAGAKPVEWRLLTNRCADTCAEVVELIDWYRARWEIEMLFDILKNACRIESLQLEHIDKLERAIAMYLVVAWRIAHLMRLGRTCPDLDAARFFDWAEIRAAYMRSKAGPPTIPKLNEVLRLIAGFGGFLGAHRLGDDDQRH